MRYVDRDGDGRVSHAEAAATRTRNLGIIERAIASVAAVFTRYNDQVIFDDCDANRDGYIDADDFARSSATCLARCETVMQFFEYVCDREEAREHHKHGSHHKS